MSFIFEKLKNGAILITPRIIKDPRGFFLETYKYSEFKNCGIFKNFVQDNHSLSSKNVLRGIHFQMNPKPQGKLVRCIKGSILDVAVDLRTYSDSYKEWISVELSEENKKMLWIPEEYGHGFLTLSEVAEINYKCTEEYDPSLDSGIAWNDPDINIDWGIENPIISEKDKGLPNLIYANTF